MADNILFDESIFLDKNDINTFHLLDEGYHGGTINKDASTVYEKLADRLDTIEDTYSDLFYKGYERSQAEGVLFDKCFQNLVLECSMRLWNCDGNTLIERFEEVSQEPNLDSSQTVLKESLRTVIERKRLELPQVGKSM